MKLGLICALGALTVVVGGLALIVGSPRARTQPQAGGPGVRPRPTATSRRLDKLTRARLVGMHVFLTRAPRSVALTAAQADRALEARGITRGNGEILETDLATCSMTPHPVAYRLPYEDRPCWVIVLKPRPVAVIPPLGSDLPAVTITPTIRFALVDANTGVVFSEADGYTAGGRAGRRQTQPAVARRSF